MPLMSRRTAIVVRDYCLLIALPLICTWAAYVGSLQPHSEYVFDDQWGIQENKDVFWAKASWWDVLKDDFWGKEIWDPHSNKSYRPFTIATYRWQLSYGVGSIVEMRIVNLVLHGLNSVMTAFMAKALFAGEGDGGVTQRVLESMAGCLFAVHPIHVEAVVNLVGRAELLQAFFGFISFLIIHHWTTTPPTRVLSWIAQGAVLVVAFVGGCFSKDSFISLYAVYGVLCVWSCIRRGDRIVVRWRHIVYCLIPVATYLAFRFWLLQGTADLSKSQLLRREENPHLFIEDPLEKKIFIWYLQCKNALFLVWPWPLCAEYSYNCLPKIERSDLPFRDPRVMPMVVGTTVLMGTLLYKLVQFCRHVWRRSRVVVVPSPPSPCEEQKEGERTTEPVAPQREVCEKCGQIIRNPKLFRDVGTNTMAENTEEEEAIVSADEVEIPEEFEVVQQRLFSQLATELICVAWVIFPFLPVSHIFVTVGTMLAERCLYIPSVGVCLLVPLIAFRMVKPDKLKHSQGHHAALILQCSSFFAVVLGVGIMLSIWRSDDWITNEQLFRTATEVCYGSAKNHQQLGLALYNRQRFKEGAAEMRLALRIDPHFCEVEWHIARYLVNRSLNEEAMERLKSCSACPPTALNCLQVYTGLRKTMMPNMSYGEENFDTAEAVGNVSLGASMYRQAGLAFEKEKNMCQASRSFDRSIRVRLAVNQTSLLIDLDQAIATTENSMCNVLYWAVKTSKECATRNNKLDLKNGPKLIRNLLRYANLSWKYCRTDWTQFFLLDSNQTMEREEMLMRPQAVNNIAVEVLPALAVYRDHLKHESEAVSADHLLTFTLQAILPLCEMWSGSNSGRRAYKAKYGREEKQILETFGSLARQLSLEYLELLKSIVEDEIRLEATVTNFLEEIKCSPHLYASIHCEASKLILSQSYNRERQVRHRRVCSNEEYCKSTAKECRKM